MHSSGAATQPREESVSREIMKCKWNKEWGVGETPNGPSTNCETSSKGIRYEVEE